MNNYDTESQQIAKTRQTPGSLFRGIILSSET